MFLFGPTNQLFLYSAHFSYHFLVQTRNSFLFGSYCIIFLSSAHFSSHFWALDQNWTYFYNFFLALDKNRTYFYNFFCALDQNWTYFHNFFWAPDQNRTYKFLLQLSIHWKIILGSFWINIFKIYSKTCRFNISYSNTWILT